MGGSGPWNIGTIGGGEWFVGTSGTINTVAATLSSSVPMAGYGVFNPQGLALTCRKCSAAFLWPYTDIFSGQITMLYGFLRAHLHDRAADAPPGVPPKKKDEEKKDKDYKGIPLSDLDL